MTIFFDDDLLLQKCDTSLWHWDYSGHLGISPHLALYTESLHTCWSESFPMLSM